MTASTKYSSQHQLDFSKAVHISEAGDAPPQLSEIVLKAQAGKDPKFQTSVEKGQKRATFAPPAGAQADAQPDAKTLLDGDVAALHAPVRAAQGGGSMRDGHRRGGTTAIRILPGRRCGRGRSPSSWSSPATPARGWRTGRCPTRGPRIWSTCSGSSSKKDHEDTHGLTPTGELDGPTSGALEEIYGS
jgi:hypothetical protein